ncbi:fumarylacetoacetate hydrolase family protein [Actinomadura roseirufa]|uniref:fumarylacetoacetate hydrolase family protein n=1 Tax=Actinomadura roseirufa TaxID=2094049 RepID=UPI0010419875|nr:fumarylacetoacetate hydrolase family protein [Actinomadura roseirufa]
MRIANSGDRLYIVRGERAHDVAEISQGRFSPDPQAIYERWDEFLGWADALPADPPGVPLAELPLGAPVPRPRQVFAIGLNYALHVAEAKKDLPLPEFPSTFTKFPACLAGPDDVVELSGDTVDWEVELVAVIGRPAHRVAESDGWSHIAGLTVGQDISDRTVQLRPPTPQFSLGKSFPGFGPTGPYVVTPDELPDRDDLAIGCTLNGEEVQSSRTGHLIFGIPALVAELSAVTPLLPGDLIFTGTPSGVGVAREPKRFLGAGDELVSTIEGIGSIRTRFAARRSAALADITH